MDSILTSTHEIQEQQAEKVTNHRRMGEEDGIVLLGVSKDQQHYIQHHIQRDAREEKLSTGTLSRLIFDTKQPAKEPTNPIHARLNHRSSPLPEVSGVAAGGGSAMERTGRRRRRAARFTQLMVLNLYSFFQFTRCQRKKIKSNLELLC